MAQRRYSKTNFVDRSDNWFSANAKGIGRSIEVVFGLVWLTDAYFKLSPTFMQSYSDLIAAGGAGQPSWLAGWFSFWSGVTASSPSSWATLIFLLEFALGISLVFGFLRKIGYGGGFLFSLLIWSVPEGFGGPYGPSSTDIGTGVIYALVFLFLAVISATYGANKYTIDSKIEKILPWWKKLAEIKH